MWCLRPQTFVCELEPGVVQVGSTARHSVLFSHLTKDEVTWIKALAKPESKRRTRPQESAILPDRLHTIIGMLDAADLLATDTSPIHDLTVRVVGLDRIGARIAMLLAEANISALELRDRRTVDASVGSVFSTQDMGQTRQSALRKRIRHRHPTLPVGAIVDPDLVIVTGGRVWDHGLLGRLLSQDLPHIPVMQDDRTVTIGPLIAPGITACALCVDLHIHDRLPLWPKVALALASAEVPRVADHLCMAAAGLTVTMVEAVAAGIPLEGTDGPTGSAGGLTQSWRLTTAGVETGVWSPHPDCSCRIGPLTPMFPPSSYLYPAKHLVNGR